MTATHIDNKFDETKAQQSNKNSLISFSKFEELDLAHYLSTEESKQEYVTQARLNKVFTGFILECKGADGCGVEASSTH